MMQRNELYMRLVEELSEIIEKRAAIEACYDEEEAEYLGSLSDDATIEMREWYSYVGGRALQSEMMALDEAIDDIIDEYINHPFTVDRKLADLVLAGNEAACLLWSAKRRKTRGSNSRLWARKADYVCRPVFEGRVRPMTHGHGRPVRFSPSEAAEAVARMSWACKHGPA